MANNLLITPETPDSSQGATIRPRYVERTPPMWAVGETDMIGLSIAVGVANVAFAIGSFCLGFAVNILVSYSGAETLTPVGEFLLNRGMWLLAFIALIFYGIGAAFLFVKGSLWKKIKSESRQIPQ